MDLGPHYSSGKLRNQGAADWWRACLFDALSISHLSQLRSILFLAIQISPLLRFHFVTWAFFPASWLRHTRRQLHHIRSRGAKRHKALNNTRR